MTRYTLVLILVLACAGHLVAGNPKPNWRRALTTVAAEYWPGVATGAHTEPPPIHTGDGSVRRLASAAGDVSQPATAADWTDFCGPLGCF